MFFIILFTYIVSAVVACLNFVLISQAENFISGLDITATQFICPTALLYDIFSSLDDVSFFSFNSLFDQLISEMQLMQCKGFCIKTILSSSLNVTCN